MTDRETTVTEDLNSVLRDLYDLEYDRNLKPQIKRIENAISKIQHLRCEATAQLDKL